MFGTCRFINQFHLYRVYLSMESSNSSYCPSKDASSEDNCGHDISYVSTRARSSQMSISSQGSAVGLSPVVAKRGKKPFGQFQRRRQLGNMRNARKKIALGKSKQPSSHLPITPRDSTTLLVDVQPDASCSNIVLNISTLQSVLNAMAICSKCASGKLKITAQGMIEGSASYVSMACNNCDFTNKFWSSGSRFRERLTVGDSSITKRSDLIYSSVLAPRIMGVGWDKLHLYHSFLNIPGPITSGNFGLVQADILVAARVVADKSMKLAVEELRVFHNTPYSSQFVTAVGTFDGAYQQRSENLAGGSHVTASPQQSLQKQEK